MKPVSVKNVNSVEEAVAVLQESHGTARPLAGGTDLISGLKKNIFGRPPETLVNMKTIPDLAYVQEDGEVLRIGAMTTLDAVANSDLIKSYAPMVADAAYKAASPLLRYSGTIAGNICQDVRCWYFRAEDNYFDCIMKGGDTCYALRGDNRKHSVFGAAGPVGPSACSQGCPTGVDIASYMRLIQDDKIDEAARKLLETNALPAITGRTCPHTCEPVCSRKDMDEEVGIRSVERFLGDYILANSSSFMTVDQEPTGKRLAVIGSGPAGLAAAFEMRKAGHDVDVLDKFDTAGGLLAHGLPQYRLPRDVVEKQIAAFEGMGVTFKLGVDVGKDVSMEELSAQYDAIFVGAGAWKERKVGFDGEDLCLSGIEVLDQIADGNVDLPGIDGGRVLVLGAGNAGVDVATTVKRSGADVLVIDRMAEEDVQVLEAELKTAREDGVQFDYLTSTTRVVKQGDRLAVSFMTLKREGLDDNGRPVLTPVDGSERTEVFDTVLKCIGELADTSFLSDEQTNALETNVKVKAAVSVEDTVFAGGDFISGPSTVVQALAAGRYAALQLSRRLVRKETNGVLKSYPVRHFNPEVIEKAPGKIQVSERSVAERATSPLEEDIKGLSAGDAKCEASRCMTCGCISASPSDVAPVLLALGARFKTTKRTLEATSLLQTSEGKLHSLDEDELITEIEVPKQSNASQQFIKFRTRGSIDFATASVASSIELDGGKISKARVVLGAVAPVPLRARAAETFLEGKEITESVAAEAADLAVSRAIGSKWNAYKIQIARALVKQAVLDSQ